MARGGERLRRRGWRSSAAPRSPAARASPGRSGTRSLFFEMVSTSARAASAPVVPERFPGRPSQRDERLQRLLDVRLERDLGRIVLAEFPVASPICTIGMPSGSGSTRLCTDMRSTSAPRARSSRSWGDERRTHLVLVAGERAHEARDVRRGNAPRRPPSAGTPARRALRRIPPPRSARRGSPARGRRSTPDCSPRRRRSASRSSASSEGRDARVDARALPRSSGASASRMSPGRQMNTGPVGGVIATLAARCTMRGRSWTRVTSIAHFTSGAAIGTSGS